MSRDLKATLFRKVILIIQNAYLGAHVLSVCFFTTFALKTDAQVSTITGLKTEMQAFLGPINF